ncbi:MAG TPA: hypothetical protein VE733_20955 [Streptosporangiaceae bacterium]|jgi:hypothetical protein|nr:hypothetical protein [Streptosporangiaceae bacterium]
MCGLRGLTAGTCCAWPLPLDASCAKAARRLYRDAAAEVGITADLIYDGITMASELAANTLHAYENFGSRGSLRHHDATLPELWLYLRGCGTRRELVCKIFDSYPGWKLGNPPGRNPVRTPAQAVSGRGLQVVNELSHGRWGHHLTRARLSVRRVRGKAVWFALPAPAEEPGWGPDGAADDAQADGAVIDCWHQLSARQAMKKLETMLAARGLGGRLVRADRPAVDLSVLWIPHGVTVWCRDGAVSLKTPAGDSQHWTYADLVDVTERAVWMHEEMEHSAGPSAPPGPAAPSAPAVSGS